MYPYSRRSLQRSLGIHQYNSFLLQSENWYQNLAHPQAIRTYSTLLPNDYLPRGGCCYCSPIACKSDLLAMYRVHPYTDKHVRSDVRYTASKGFQTELRCKGATGLPVISRATDLPCTQYPIVRFCGRIFVLWSSRLALKIKVAALGSTS